jgi:ABC-type amino acid transport substrate-binding protein
MNWFCVTAAAVLLSLPFADASGATLDQVKKRGSIAIAVKSDYKPSGFIGQSGELEGMEADLARDIAKQR